MTCIVGLEAQGRVWLGSDSYAGSDVNKDILDRPKWFKKGALTFAFAGSFRAAQVVEHHVVIPAIKRNENHLSYIVMVVAKSLRKGLEEGGATIRKSGTPEGTETTFLLAFQGKLYLVQEDYSIVRSQRGFAAIGTGADFALGSMAALKSRLSPKDAVLESLKHSAEWCPQVSAPFYVESF